jgi:GNAT superfamily N-acetyltransferase
MPRTTFRPVTSDDWTDLQALFGPRGACGGCWCMWWRLPRSEFKEGAGEDNRKAMKKLLDAGVVPGVIAYEGDRPVGWCAIAPREHFPALDRSRVLARVDSEPVWSIVCFFVAKDRRKTGLTGTLIEASVRYAKRNGALIVEGYPVQKTEKGTADVFAYTGFDSAFKRAGFTEAARRSPHRAVYRLSTRTPRQRRP